ncbi:hypothetical protein [Streptomyces sp. NPDC004546]|uniref:hypothetical protein n=1 Tax=Streptomyces sp. NPDC004546 TaxID=3154282 RepID=UPI0033B3BAEA
MATNLTDDGDQYGLIHADDLRHLRLIGDRPRLLAQVPGGEVSGWVPLVDSPEPSYARFSGSVGSEARPPLPEHFHLELAAALDAARLQVREEGHSVVVRAVVERSGWVWRAVSYGAILGQRSASVEVPAAHAVAS